VGATLRGDELRFAFNDDKGVTRTFTGRINGNQLTGTVRAAGGGETTVNGSLQGQPRVGEWANMLSQCSRFYGR
jgi:hypothetical protein